MLEQIKQKLKENKIIKNYLKQKSKNKTIKNELIPCKKHPNTKMTLNEQGLYYCPICKKWMKQ